MNAGCDGRRMVFHQMKKLAWAVMMLIGMGGASLAKDPLAANPVAIPFMVHLTGYENVPPFDYGLAACGKLWLVGTNLHYRFACIRPPWVFQISGPAAPGTNGPFIVHDQMPSPVSQYGYDLCQTAATPANSSTEGTRFFTYEDVLMLTDAQLPELFNGLFYAQITFRVGPPQPFPANLTVRGQIRIDNTDSDGDGLPDYLDECPNSPPGSLINSNGCSIADFCPCEGPWKNHGEFEHCVKEAAKDFRKAGLITEPQRHEIEKAAHESDCGKKEKSPKPPKPGKE